MQNSASSQLTLEIVNLTRSPAPNLPYEKVAHAILPAGYDLSIAIIGRRRSLNLNKKYRNKDKPLNVLSFETDKNSGEFFLSPSLIKRGDELFMFIHGLLHLALLDHGPIMEAKEQEMLSKFKRGKTNHNRS